MPLSLNQIYLWKRTSFPPKYAWDRKESQHFLKTELKRIEIASIWRKKFDKAEHGERLESVEYYVLPTKANTKEIIAGKMNNFNVFQLSAIKDCEEEPILMILPIGKKSPEENSLIRITSSIKDHLTYKKINIGAQVINVEAFEEIDPSIIYDIYGQNKLEKNRVFNFFKENFDQFIVKFVVFLIAIF